MVLLHHLYTFLMLGVVCHGSCSHACLVRSLHIDKTYSGKHTCHGGSGYMDGSQLVILSELFFRHSLIKLPIGRKSDRFSTECGSFIPMVRRTISCFNCRCRVFMLWRNHRSKIIFPFGKHAYFTLLIFLCALLAVNLSIRGGFLTVYRNMKSSAHRHASGPPLYTLFGTLYFDYADELPELTEEQEHEIHNWLSERPALVPVPDIASRDNCIFILAESLESWVLNLTVENQEITPYLNKLLKERSTLYAPMCLHKSTEGVPLMPSCLCSPVCCHCRPAHTVAGFLSIHTTLCPRQ